MLLLIKYTLLYGIVLMLVALGGMFSEHSGIINIALEGIMVIGGVAGVLTLTMLPASLSPFLVVLISILVAALAGVIYSLLFGLCLYQPEGGPDHWRYGTEPAGYRHCRGHLQVLQRERQRQAELFQQALPVQHRRAGTQRVRAVGADLAGGQLHRAV